MPPTEEVVEEQKTTDTATQTDKTKAEDEPKIYSESYVRKLHSENANRRIREDQLNARIKEFEDKEAEREQQRLAAEGEYKKAAEKAEERRKAAEKERDERVAEAHRDARNAKIEALAVRKGVRDEAIDDVLLQPELQNVKLDEISSALDKLIEKKPHWKKPDVKDAGDGTGEKHVRRGTQASPSGQGSGTGSGDDAKAWSKDRLKSEWETVRRL